MNARLFLLGLLCGGVAVAGCSSSEGPVAGELELRFASPNLDDRAILVRVAGPATAVTAPSGSGYRVLVSKGNGDTARVLVIAPQGSHLVPGALARLTVPDTRHAGSYAAIPLDAASTAYVQRSTSGYSLTVVKP